MIFIFLSLVAGVHITDVGEKANVSYTRIWLHPKCSHLDHLLSEHLSLPSSLPPCLPRARGSNLRISQPRQGRGHFSKASPALPAPSVIFGIPSSLADLFLCRKWTPLPTQKSISTTPRGHLENTGKSGMQVDWSHTLVGWIAVLSPAWGKSKSYKLRSHLPACSWH